MSWPREGLVYHDPQSPGILLPWHSLERGNRLKGPAPAKNSLCPGDQNVLTKPIYHGLGVGQLPLFPSTDKDTKAERGEAEPYWEPVLGLAGRGTQATSLGTRVWAPLSLLARLQGGSLAEGSVPCPC